MRKILMVGIVLSLGLISCGSKNDSKKKETEKEVQPKIALEAYTGELGSGSIKSIKDFPSEYVRPRNVDIWLPNSYSEDKKYAVLYMHDGQMLFDAKTTWNKQEWKVDEIVGGLLDEGKIQDCIVVAMWNHADIRHSDYFPQKPFEMLPQTFKDTIIENAKRGNNDLFSTEINSDNYLKFIVKEVKPYIDANFPVYTDREHTFVSGSSMGGLISMYAISEYPEVFGGAACLSTHWPGIMPMENNPVPYAFFDYMKENLPDPNTHKLYFDFGTETLDQYYVEYEDEVNAVLKEKGYTEENSRNLKFEGTDHSENSWNQRFGIPVEFLLNKN